MVITKRELISRAFKKLGFGASTIHLSTDRFQNGLETMDSMIAEWGATKDIVFGYPLNNPSDFDDACDIPDFVIKAIVLNLSNSLGPDYGKVIQQPRIIEAGRALRNVATWAMKEPKGRSLAGLPKGAGHRTIGPSDSFISDDNESETRDGLDFI